MNKPLYKHDCKKCKFLGSYQDEDLYIDIRSDKHNDSYGRITILSRRSSNPSDYTSGLIFSFNYWNSDKNNPMSEALVRALMINKFKNEIIKYCKKYESEFDNELNEMIVQANTRKTVGEK